VLTVSTGYDHAGSVTVLNEPIHFFGPDAIQDPYPVYDALRKEGPVHRVGESPFYLVCSWDAIIEAIARVDDFSSNLTATMVYQEDGTVVPFTMGQPGGSEHVLATADDPLHAEHRKILLPHLSAKRVRIIEQFVAQTAKRLWEENLGNDGRYEWMSAMANRLPMMVVAKLLGLPQTDVENLIRCGYATTALLDGLITSREIEAAGRAGMELGGYVLEHFDKAAIDPQPGLISDLATRCASGEVNQVVALTIMLTLFSAAGESTASLLGSSAWILVDKPAIQDQLRDNPELLGNFIEETLRFEPPFRGHYRHVLRDTSLCGVNLPADSHLLLLWGAANRDPVQFDEPNEFRLDRPAAKGHVAFGKGTHFCIGAALARLEAQIVLRTLLESTDWIDAVEVGPWLPSILVRRRERLRLAVQ
jgi:cytochrome P450 family 144